MSRFLAALLMLSSCGVSLLAQETTTKSELQAETPTDSAQPTPPDQPEPAKAGEPSSSEEDAASAEPPTEIPTEMPPEVREELNKRLERFKETQTRLTAEVLNERAVQIKYLNREERSPAARDAFHDSRQKVRALLDETYTAALDVLRISFDQEAATFVITMVQHRFDNDIYSADTLEGAARMIDGGSKLLYLYLAGGRSAVVTGKFDLAKKLYEALHEEDLGVADRSLAANLEAHQEIWEAEQKIREQEAADDNLPRVLMRTSQGDVVLELFINEAPSTVSHFIQLVEDGFYDGLDFHQVINNLLAMTGDPTGDGSGDSGKLLMDEHEREDARKAFRGSLMMAKLPMGDTGNFFPNSSSSQFVIFLLPIVSASDNQTVFGRVIEGMDVVSRLRRVDPSKKKDKKTIVLPPDRVIEATVIRRPDELPEVKYLERLPR
ncbi:MAG: peptidylprolyl isomerase [Rubripirellula sp.]